MQEFFSMDGYALFVWSSVAVFLAVIIGNWWASLRARNNLQRELLARIRRQSSTSSNPGAKQQESAA